MTQDDFLLVLGMISVAVAITVGDLLLSLWRHRRRAAPVRVSRPVSIVDGAEDAEAAARRDAIRRRLAAIQAASGERGAPTPPVTGVG